jgi:uncharacterized membrane protein
MSKNIKNNTERWAANVLKLGVGVSAALMIGGLIIAAVWPSSVIPFSVNPPLADLFIRIFSGNFDPVTLMFTGLVLLMFTPVLRVITTIFGFAIEKDRRFVFVSSVVLFMLAGEIIYSLFIK